MTVIIVHHDVSNTSANDNNSYIEFSYATDSNRQTIDEYEINTEWLATSDYESEEFIEDKKLDKMRDYRLKMKGIEQRRHKIITQIVRRDVRGKAGRW